MTNEEYDKMFQISKKSFAETLKTTTHAPQMTTEEVILKKLNLRTLKGAFIVLLLGFILSFAIFILEQFRFDAEAIGKVFRRFFCRTRILVKAIWKFIYHRIIVKVIQSIMFKYRWD